MDALRIGFDCDDVLVNSADYTARMYNETHGTSLTRRHWYDFRSMEPWGVDSLPIAIERVNAVMHAENFTELEPLQGAKTTLSRLKALGHSLLIITGRPETLRHQTADMLGTLFPRIFDEDDLYFTNHFGDDPSKRTKAEVATEIALTHFVDDQVEHVNSMVATGVRTLLFSDNYAWNQTGADSRVVRVGSWQEIGDYFDEQQRAN